MRKESLIAAMVVVLLAGGCARNTTVDPSFYDNQWGKSGATEDDFRLASHECDVEEQQRTALDKEEINHDRWNERYLGVYGYGHPKEDSLKERKITRQYWTECMAAHSWRVVDRQAIAHKRGPDGEILDYDEMGLTGDTNSFKPARP